MLIFIFLCHQISNLNVVKQAKRKFEVYIILENFLFLNEKVLCLFEEWHVGK